MQLKNSITEVEELPVLWCTQGEIKDLLKQSQDEDEQAVINYLANKGELTSVSCRIYTEWELTREKVRKMMNKLSYGRMLQVTLGSVLGATRFKIPEGRGLGMVACPNCGQLDSWEHCQRCYEVTAPVKGKRTEKEWLEEVDCTVNKLCRPNPAKNEPFKKTTKGQTIRKEKKQ